MSGPREPRGRPSVPIENECSVSSLRPPHACSSGPGRPAGMASVPCAVRRLLPVALVVSAPSAAAFLLQHVWSCPLTWPSSAGRPAGRPGAARAAAQPASSSESRPSTVVVQSRTVPFRADPAPSWQLDVPCIRVCPPTDRSTLRSRPGSANVGAAIRSAFCPCASRRNRPGVGATTRAAGRPGRSGRPEPGDHAGKPDRPPRARPNRSCCFPARAVRRGTSLPSARHQGIRAPPHALGKAHPRRAAYPQPCPPCPERPPSRPLRSGRLGNARAPIRSRNGAPEQLQARPAQPRCAPRDDPPLAGSVRHCPRSRPGPISRASSRLRLQTLPHECPPGAPPTPSTPRVSPAEANAPDHGRSRPPGRSITAAGGTRRARLGVEDASDSSLFFGTPGSPAAQAAARRAVPAAPPPRLGRHSHHRARARPSDRGCSAPRTGAPCPEANRNKIAGATSSRLAPHRPKRHAGRRCSRPGRRGGSGSSGGPSCRPISGHRRLTAFDPDVPWRAAPRPDPAGRSPPGPATPPLSGAGARFCGHEERRPARGGARTRPFTIDPAARAADRCAQAPPPRGDRGRMSSSS